MIDGSVVGITLNHARKVLGDLLARSYDYESMDFECITDVEREAIRYFVTKRRLHRTEYSL